MVSLITFFSFSDNYPFCFHLFEQRSILVLAVRLKSTRQVPIIHIVDHTTQRRVASRAYGMFFLEFDCATYLFYRHKAIWVLSCVCGIPRRILIVSRRIRYGGSFRSRRGVRVCRSFLLRENGLERWSTLYTIPAGEVFALIRFSCVENVSGGFVWILSNSWHLFLEYTQPLDPITNYKTGLIISNHQFLEFYTIFKVLFKKIKRES